jgi:peptidoglycan/LPS O-acetylase OafA/YrhL
MSLTKTRDAFFSRLQGREHPATSSVKIHFKGLNALRFYAAISVVVHHIMFNPYVWFKMPNLPDTIGRFFIGGTDAVFLFFVLSGFLITYLMLVERERSGTVAVKKFYLRRILRIWPLYFALIFVAFFIVPLLVPNYKNPLSTPLLAALLLLFQGNIAFIIYYPFPPLEHLWSIAIEEQFYLVIPHIGKSGANLAKVFIVIMVFWWALMAFLRIFMPDNFFAIVILNLRFDVIAIGGAFACAYYYKHWILKWLYHPIVSGLSLLVVAFIAIFVPETPDFPAYSIIISFAFAVVIINVATNDKFFLKLDHPWLEAAGNWSYGIYMIHTVILLLFLSYMQTHMNDFIYQVGVYPIIITATIVLAWLSYRYFETPFLRLKDTFKVTR